MSSLKEQTQLFEKVGSSNDVSNPRLQKIESIVDVSDIDKEQQQSIVPLPHSEPDDRHVTNVTSASAGAKVLFATDEWFSSADNLIQDSEPHFDPTAYCEQGKVMDGWETRRRREAGNDWCVIKLASRVHNIVGVEVDTAYFTGNNAPAISLELADITSCDVETEMVTGFPNAIQRLLHGSVQGTGHTPAEVQQAEIACRKNVVWEELLPKTPLKPGYEDTRMHYFDLQGKSLVGTHLRVNYFPDGGVARLRLLGSACDSSPTPIAGPAYSPIETGPRCRVVKHGSVPIMPSEESFEFPELSSEKLGGMGLICSNKHYGDPSNLIQRNFGQDMGDGWETARHPSRPPVLVKNPTTGLVDSPLSDWCIIKLGSVSDEGIARIILDTKHFRGNYPESVQVEGCLCLNDDELLMDDNETVIWFPLIERIRMAPDSEHVFDRSKDQVLNANSAVSHLRITIFPDGGLSRVRVYAKPSVVDFL